jgi:hypothetical protein
VPKIADFGLARPLTTDSSLAAGARTQTGAILGTPSYMAPEQAGGKSKAVGPGADVWALGAILYECLTGRPPFRAATMLDTLLQVAADDPAAPRKLRPDCPRDLETICLKCLQKEPSRRYATAGALADDLGHFLAGEPIAARPAGRLERLRRALKRRREWVYLAAGALAVAGVSLMLLQPWRVRYEPPPPPTTPAEPAVAIALPEDLRLLPASVDFLVSIRPGDLWGREDVRTLTRSWLRVVLPLPAELRGQAVAEGEAKIVAALKTLGLGSEHVERITGAGLRGIDPGNMVFVMKLSQSVRAEVLGDLLGKGASKRQVQGMTLFVEENPIMSYAGGTFGDRILVWGPEPALRWLAERSADLKPGPASPVLALAAQRHALVAGFNLKHGLSTFLAGMPAPPGPEGLQMVTAVVDLPEPSPGKALTGLSVEVVGECASEEKAGAILNQIRDQVKGVTTLLDATAGSAPFGRFYPLLTGPLRAAQYQQDGSHARLRVQVQWKPEDMAELQKAYIDRDRHSQAQNNLTQIGKALTEYAKKNGGRLPAAAVHAKDGRPLLSWRVLLLPHLRQEPLFKQFRLDEAWDGPTNKKLLDRMPPVYALDPADLDARPTPETVYRAVVGRGAAFEGREGVPLKDFTNGVAHAAVVVTAGPPTPWTKPDDWPYDPAKPAPRPAGVFADGFFALFADGTVRLLPATLDEKSWRAMMTRKAADKPPMPAP